MSALEEKHVEHARNRAVENRLQKLEADVEANARFRQRVQGVGWFVTWIIGLVAGSLSIARFLEGFL